MATYKFKVTPSTPYLRHKFPRAKLRDLLHYTSASQQLHSSILYMEIMRTDFENNMDTMRACVLDIPENNIALNQLQAEYRNVWMEQYAVLKSLLDCEEGDTVVEDGDEKGV